MSYRDSQIKCSESGNECGCGITLNHYYIRSIIGEDFFDPCEHARRYVKEILIFFQDVQVIIGLNIEDLQDLVKEPSMLACGATDEPYLVRAPEHLVM